jgi:hypothetical protein
VIFDTWVHPLMISLEAQGSPHFQAVHSAA